MRRLMQNGNTASTKRPPRTPRKLRGPEPSSPEVMKSTPPRIAKMNGVSSSPEHQRRRRLERTHARLNGVLNDEGITKGDKGTQKSIANTSSPRKLPDDRFQSIVKQLNGTKRMNGVNGVADHDLGSVAGDSNSERPMGKKQPRKLSVAHAANGVDGTGVAPNTG